jgi:hypothetical protein
VNNPLDVKENDEHALEFVFHLYQLYSISASLDFPCMAQAFFLERLSNHCQGVRHTFPRFAKKIDAVPLSDPL